MYFMDVTYYATPPINRKYKLMVILAFNKDLFKSIICNLSIIENENTETFIQILKFLKIKYNWKPEKISIYFSKSEKKSLNFVFPIIQIVPYFFHFITNL